MTTTEPQHLVALRQANAVRLARAAVYRRIRSGEATVADVIFEPSLETATIADLLRQQRRWGDTRIRKFLLMIPMSEQKTVGALTDRQRDTLIRLLGLIPPSPPPRPRILPVPAAPALVEVPAQPAPARELTLICRGCSDEMKVPAEAFLEHNGFCDRCRRSEQDVRKVAARANRHGIQAVAVNHRAHGWIVKVPTGPTEPSLVLRTDADLLDLLAERGVAAA